MVLLSTACALNPPASSPASSGSPITEASVRGHMSFLASDALNGRGSGTRDEWIAASYLGAQMQAWGLEPLGDAGSFVQQIEIDRPETAAPPTVVADGRTFTHGKELRITILAAPRVSGPLQKYTAAAAVKAGAVVLLPPSSDAVVGKQPAEPSIPALIASGAAAIVRLADPFPPVAPNAPLPAPAATIVGAQSPPQRRAAQVLLRKETYEVFAKLAEGATVTIEAEQKAAARTQTWNAVGRLPGSDPVAAKEVILLSAHLDHLGVRNRPNAPADADSIYNGADDDASGTIAVLELAHALAIGPRPKRTIVFAFFGSEEVGGFGSRFFADKPVVPLTEVVANLQFEMIGRPDEKVPPHTLWLTGYERSTLGSALSKQGAKLVQDPHPQQNFFFRSDNIQFARRGVVAHTVSSFGLHKEYHQASDEISKIDFAHMTDAIQSMIEPIRWLANSGFKPDWLPGMKPQ
jgi:aminopeptidase YwaD